MKNLLTVMSVLEGVTGIAVIAAPSFVSSLLLATSLEGAGLIIARLAGVALLTLAVACWLARLKDASATSGTVTAMLLYNTGAAIVFVYAWVGYQLVGILLVPAVIAHVLLAIWCAVGLRAAKQ